MRTKRKLLVLLLSAGTVLGYAHGIHSLRAFRHARHGQCGMQARGDMASSSTGFGPHAGNQGGYDETDGSSHPGFSPFSWFGARHGHHGRHGHGHGHGHGRQEHHRGYDANTAAPAPQAACGCGQAAMPQAVPPVQAVQPIQVVCPTAPAMAAAPGLGAVPMTCVPQGMPLGGLGGLGALGSLTCSMAPQAGAAAMPMHAAPGGIAPGLRDPFTPAAPPAALPALR